MSAPELCPFCAKRVKVVRLIRDVRWGDRTVVIWDEFYRCDECDEEFFTPEQADEHNLKVQRGLEEP